MWKNFTLISLIAGLFMCNLIAQSSQPEVNSQTSTIISSADIDPIIYPNPAADYFSITNSESVLRVDIMNIVGMKIKAIEANGITKMDISELRSGMYLINLIDKNNKVIKTVRLLKE